MSKSTKSPARLLTPRQREIVRLVSLGCTETEMASILGVSASTVNNHRVHAMKRLGAHRIAVLTRMAIKHRISSLKDKLSPSEKRRLKRRK
jgi:DNA-binding CsgD family transcriptional regulator